MTDLGITYEEANPPKPYCKRCGKKLGTEAHDVHTCTPMKKEWVGLTDEEIRKGNKDSWVTRQAWESAVWWAEEKLKEKNT